MKIINETDPIEWESEAEAIEREASEALENAAWQRVANGLPRADVFWRTGFHTNEGANRATSTVFRKYVRLVNRTGALQNTAGGVGTVATAELPGLLVDLGAMLATSHLKKAGGPYVPGYEDLDFLTLTIVTGNRPEIGNG